MDILDLIKDDDDTIAVIAETLQEIKEGLDRGELTKEQAAELTEDVKQIHQMEDLAKKVYMKHKIQKLYDFIKTIT